MAAKYSIVPEDKGIITEQLLKNLSDVNNDHNQGDIVQAKVVSIIFLGLGSFLLGLLPLQLAKWFTWKFNNTQTKSNNLVISLLLCFGGGVLMFTTFIHLQPEVREEMDELIQKGEAPEFDHFADLVFCLGFFFVYLIEEVVHCILDQKHNHSEDETCLHRTVSLRKCNKTNDPNCDQNEGTLPRVSLNQGVDEKSLETNPKSTSTQVLIDSSKIASIYDTNGNTSFEENYPTKPVLLNSENQIIAGKLRLYSEHPETNEKSDKDTNKKNFYEKNFQPLGKNSPKGHSHIPGIFDDETESSTSENYVKLSKTFRGFFTVLALSFHAVFEGLAVGLENEVSNVWYLFLAIAAHKFVISFCVGVDLMSTRTKVPLIILYLGTFAFVTPLGIGIGIALSNDHVCESQLSTVILQGMAAGTLLYVVFFEVLQREKANEQSGILQLMAILAGFVIMLGLQMISGHHHHHHHHLENLDVSQLSTPSSHFNEFSQKHFVNSGKH